MKTAQGVEKPLAEWTLNDTKEFCGIYTCNDCPIKHGVCVRDPHVWILEEKPKFTEQEIEDAKTLNRFLYGGLHSISRNSMTGLVACFCKSESHSLFAKLSDEYFPSIEDGCSYFYFEIIGGGDA